MRGNVVLKKGWGTKIFKYISIKYQRRTVIIVQIEGGSRSNAVPGLLPQGKMLGRTLLGLSTILEYPTNKAQCCNHVKFLKGDS